MGVSILSDGVGKPSSVRPAAESDFTNTEVSLNYLNTKVSWHYLSIYDFYAAKSSRKLWSSATLLNKYIISEL